MEIVYAIGMLMAFAGRMGKETFFIACWGKANAAGAGSRRRVTRTNADSAGKSF